MRPKLGLLLLTTDRMLAPWQPSLDFGQVPVLSWFRSLTLKERTLPQLPLL